MRSRTTWALLIVSGVLSGTFSEVRLRFNYDKSRNKAGMLKTENCISANLN